MAFRRHKDDWKEFLRHHSQELAKTGVPEYVLRDRLRFFVFLDHGFDEHGWGKAPHDFFDSRTLTDDQIMILADLVAHHFGEHYRGRISSRWQNE